MADGPDDGRKEKRQQQAEQRPGDGYDDFVEGGNFRQSCAVQIGFALDNVHRRKLRKRYEATER
ncbi:MAG: hypothetical protein Udaeo2_11720 [Candidatus Udaeobacter sp.]|nr:MAG: hypothetical protein Udaeo2_11720 [Candidatus Udaeobacter sp.]